MRMFYAIYSYFLNKILIVINIKILYENIYYVQCIYIYS